MMPPEAPSQEAEGGCWKHWYKLACLRTMPKLEAKIKEMEGPVGSFAAVTDAMLRGIGQVFFQSNPVSGLLMLIGILAADITTGVCALIGVLTATLFAKLLRVDPNLWAAGLFGYNGCLCGCALAVFAFGVGGPVKEEKFTQILLTYTGIVLTSCLSVLLQGAVAKLSVQNGITPLTFPFQVATWVWLLGVQQWSFGAARYSLTPGLAIDYVCDGDECVHIPTGAIISTQRYGDAGWFMESVLVGIAQTFLCAEWYSGALMLVGIFLCSPLSALWTVLGATGGTACAMMFGVDSDVIAFGLYGYNGALVAIALGGFFVLQRGYRHSILVVFAIIITTMVTSATSSFFAPIGIPALTWPFTVVTWVVVLSLQNEAIPDVIIVKIEDLSCAEDHLQHIHGIKEWTVEHAVTEETIAAYIAKNEETKLQMKALGNMRAFVKKKKQEHIDDEKERKVKSSNENTTEEVTRIDIHPPAAIRPPQTTESHPLAVNNESVFDGGDVAVPAEPITQQQPHQQASHVSDMLDDVLMADVDSDDDLREMFL